MIVVLNIIWLMMLLIYLISKRIKFEKKEEHDYLREFPSTDSPLMVGYLIDGKIHSNDILAQILYMISDKKISYSNGTLYLLEDINDFNSYEAEIVKLVFDMDSEMSILKLKYRLKNNYVAAQHHLEGVNFDLLSESRIKNYFDYNIERKVISFLYLVVEIVLTFIVIQSNLYLGLINLLIILCLIYLIFMIQPLTKEGENMKTDWLKLKKFLKEFSNMDTKEIEDIYFFEKYLAYATSFGLSNRIAKKIKFSLTNIDEVNINEFDDLIELRKNFKQNIYHRLNWVMLNRQKVESNNESSNNYSLGGGGFSSRRGGGGSFGGGGGGGFR